MNGVGQSAAVVFDPVAPAAVRVVLVGFMGAGKTSLARRWAESGGPTLWFDSDVATLRELGVASATEAFATEEGVAAFRATERDVILERATPLARGVEVWSLGGGALGDPDVRGVLADACVVWLDAPVDVLWERVAGSDRPLARNLDAFRSLYERRRELYERASTVRVDTSGDLDDIRLGRLLAEHLPPSWFGSGLVVGDGVLGRVDDLASLHGGQVAIVADHAVAELADDVATRLRLAGMEVTSHLDLPMGEWNKQLSTVERVLTEWAGAGLHRRGTVIAIGGGTLLDTAGFAASMYLRGVEWVSVPTTVTSQVDAGIGGKTGVNLGTAKNVVGSVHMPRATLIDPAVLVTLPPEAVRDGFVEAAKTGLLAGEWLLDLSRAVAGSSEPVGAGDDWLQLVGGCAGYKDAVVSEDPFDTDGVRAQLNLGHTIGHTIEAATGGAVSHGAAVAVGIHAALHLSRIAVDADPALVHGWHDLCASMGIPITSPLEWEQLAPYLSLDKKRDEQGIGWTLLAEVGEPVTHAYLPVELAQRVWEEHIHVARPEQIVVTQTGPGSGARSGARRAAEAASPRHPRVLVLFGANLGELGVRDPEHYGSATLAELVRDVETWAVAEGLVADCRQTDSLERFLHALHEARLRHHAVIVNPGAWTHHELSIHDALEPLHVPRVEVHLSDVSSREDWRRTSVIRSVVDHVVTGQGAAGYREALRWVRTALG